MRETKLTKNIMKECLEFRIFISPFTRNSETQQISPLGPPLSSASFHLIKVMTCKIEPRSIFKRTFCKCKGEKRVMCLEEKKVNAGYSEYKVKSRQMFQLPSVLWSKKLGKNHLWHLANDFFRQSNTQKQIKNFHSKTC